MTSVEPDALTVSLPDTHAGEPPVTVGTVGLVRSTVHLTVATLTFLPRFTLTENACRPSGRVLYVMLVLHFL